MKPFNLEEAKAGKPVCTRDGRNARIICFDLKHEYFPIVALIDDGDRELVSRFCADGRIYYRQNGCTEMDLFMAHEKHEGWINIYKGRVCSPILDSERSARGAGMGNDDYITTLKIEWEE